MRKPVKRRNEHNVLTPTEKTIIALLAAGLTAKEIAHARGVKLRTVRAQIRCIYDKTGIRRQVDLVGACRSLFAAALAKRKPLHAN